MAKDDYYVVVYKILIYLYAVFKHKKVFNETELIKCLKISEEYLNTVLKTMSDDGYIQGLKFIRPWGNEYIIINNLCDMSITSNGIEYLEDNSKMQKVKDFLYDNKDMFVPLITMILQNSINQ